LGDGEGKEMLNGVGWRNDLGDIGIVNLMALRYFVDNFGQDLNYIGYFGG
jgi:hypothetical protein